ncbi:hypothetical protein BKG83_16195 [Mycobacteroides chelonae]|uniref:flavin-containing monooxygenase n=2 Tax=Mycobacteroides chelonae TaxID=1774 RepID=UPI0008A991EC|nr:NAD(P)/FAD-dependent oxidoreductase [Mycobacteroides chelonae]OHU55753.1 hypothetical protein BKG83_16195 [Mycobacteroides chelonae]PKQ59379.1 hypothetical protein B5566_03860 [Mycobacterium sp. MHSD3]
MSRNGSAITPDHDVLVFGAGFSGIAAGVKLTEAGIDNFLIIDKREDIGGTWRDATYPNVAVDVPFFTYQFGFELKHDWSRVFPSGAEVKAYADQCVDKYGLRRHMRFGTEAVEARFDEQHEFWHVTLTDGSTITARFVISATGLISEPRLPQIPGLHDFSGPMMHSAKWDHSVDFTGKRVGVIGTGASAVQIVPWVGANAGHQYVFQRTPSWVVPKPDFAVPKIVHRALEHIPGLHRALRLLAYGGADIIISIGVFQYRHVSFISHTAGQVSKAWLRLQVRDRNLREQLTPAYQFSCKNPCISNTYWHTFNRDNTDLVTTGIDRITPTGIVTTDGVHRELDVLVLATGYGYMTREDGLAPPVQLLGRGGQGLREFYRDNRFQAYEGVTVPGFPNAFATMGPYSVTGASYLFMSEYTTHHAVRVISETLRRGARVAEVRQEPHDAYFLDIQKRMTSSIFAYADCSGSNSWYYDKHGDHPIIRPSVALEAFRRSRRFPLEHYRYTNAGNEIHAGTRPLVDRSRKPRTADMATGEPAHRTLNSAQR